MDKIVKIPVSTPKGTRYLSYRKVVEIPTDKLICDEICPYGKVCEKLRDPRYPNDKDRCFVDFCGDISGQHQENEEIKVDLNEYIPVEGTIEDNLKDIDEPYQRLVENGNLVPVGDIIEKVCSGWCDSYTPEHENCNCDNRSCILKDLFFGIRNRGKKEDK